MIIGCRQNIKPKPNVWAKGPRGWKPGDRTGTNPEPESAATASHAKEITAAANDKLMAMLTEFTFQLISDVTNMNQSMERFNVDMSTEIKQERREVKEMKKDTVVMREINRSLNTEVEAGFRNEGCERKPLL